MWYLDIGLRLLIYTCYYYFQDRLLNYKANQLAKEIIKDCINENGWTNEANNILCNEFEDARQNPDLKFSQYITHEGMIKHI